MANAYTDILSGASLGTNLVQTAYDRLVEFGLRAQPQFRAVADKRPAQQAMPGSSVVFNLYQDLAPQTGTLAETTDPDAIAIGPTTPVTVTLNEYGTAVIHTRKLDLFSLSSVDPAIANMVAWNLLDSVDSLVQTKLRTSQQLIQEAGGSLVTSTNTTTPSTSIVATDTVKSRDFRTAVAKLRGDKVVPRKGQLYAAYVHPHVSMDLRAETGAAAWRDPHNYSAPEQIWAGEIGQYEGAFFIETPRAYIAKDGGATNSTINTYRSYVFGQQALAEAVAQEFGVVIGPVVDKLKRLQPIGWYGVAGWSLYRPTAMWRVYTASTLG